MFDAFDAFKDVNTPSLVGRTARLTDREDLTDDEYTQFKDAFDDDLVDALGEGFDEIEQLDDAILSVLGYSADERGRLKKDLYPKLLMELVELKEMMD